MNELNEEQQAAVDSDAENTLVIASPGTGKTRVLVARIQRALREGILPCEIVAITFTNAAAREIQKRLVKQVIDESLWLDGPIVLGHCGTIHSYLLKLIRGHGSYIGMPSKIVVLDEEQATALLEDCAASMGYKGTKKELEIEIRQHVAAKHPRDKMLSKSQLVAVEFYYRMLRDGTLSYEAILEFGLQVLYGLPQPRLGRLLLVDEVQDISERIYEIIKKMPFNNLFLTGDPDQAIYSFSGGSVRPILDSAKREDFAVFRLERNHRSGPQICDVAQKLIEHNRDRFPKKTSAVPPKISSFEVSTFENQQQELHAVAHYIAGYSDPNNCAILCRTNYVANTVRDALQGFGVPLKKPARLNNPIDWKTCLRLIALCADPENDAAAYWFLCQTRDRAMADKLRLEAASAFTTINQRSLKIPHDLVPIACLPFLARAGIGKESLAIVNAAVDALGDDVMMNDLYLKLAFDPPDEEASDGISVQTIHSAKGLEFDVVFVVGCEEAFFPGKDDIEESRRLLFVAITRARRICILTYCAIRKCNEWQHQLQKMEPSRFLNEIEKITEPGDTKP